MTKMTDRSAVLATIGARYRPASHRENLQRLASAVHTRSVPACSSRSFVVLKVSRRAARGELRIEPPPEPTASAGRSASGALA